MQLTFVDLCARDYLINYTRLTQLISSYKILSALNESSFAKTATFHWESKAKRQETRDDVIHSWLLHENGF